MSTPQNVHMLSRDERARCSATNADGQPCGAICQLEKDVCWHHDPANTEDLRRQRSEAGKERQLQKNAKPGTRISNPPVTLETLIKTTGKTIELTRKGHLDAHRAQAVGQLIKVQQSLLKDLKAQTPKLTRGQEKLMTEAELERQIAESEMAG